jgi:RNA polymerase sigma-70 factor (ECF subfamily)
MSSPPDLSGASDQEVVALALERCTEAYTELVHRYTEPILRHVHEVVGGPKERAVDLTQISFIKVFSGLHTYRPELPFKPWIMQIAHNTAVDYVSTRPFDSPSHPPNVTPGYLDAAIDWGRPDDTPTTDPDPDRPEYRRMLKQAIRQLRPQYRRCLRLRFVKGRSLREIAKTMGLPVGTVKSHLHRALLELKEVVDTKFDISGPHPSH